MNFQNHFTDNNLYNGHNNNGNPNNGISHNIRKFRQEQIETFSKEFKKGLDILSNYPRSVSIFGSARVSENDPTYIKARSLCKKIAEELKYAIITGGGPGIMEASNRGAKEGGGRSLGLSIRLATEQKSNPYADEEMHFNYFFTRKTMLNFSAEAYVFFPGGFGTLDELFGIITLVQTAKIPAVPIILTGVDFWKPLDDFIQWKLVDEYKTINPSDRALYYMTDSQDKIINIIKNAPLSDWWDKID